jgi:hypothetical protein
MGQDFISGQIDLPILELEFSEEFKSKCIDMAKYLGVRSPHGPLN